VRETKVNRCRIAEWFRVEKNRGHSEGTNRATNPRPDAMPRQLPADAPLTTLIVALRTRTLPFRSVIRKPEILEVGSFSLV
jgi:hypothetical protein